MSEKKIEPYYRIQGKRFVDCLFDKGLLSESLSRDGMDAIEELLSFYLQLGAQSAAKCAELSKKFKARTRQNEPWEGGEDPPRHEEEMRWIARAKEAEGLVAELSIEKGKLQEENGRYKNLFLREEKADAAWAWGKKVCTFLKNGLQGFDLVEGRRLLEVAIELGITPEPDCRPKKIIVDPGSEASHIPGITIFTDARGKVLCNATHDSGAGETRCTLPKGHAGPHKNGREEWG